MKKLPVLTMCLFALALFFFACSNGSDDDDGSASAKVTKR